MNALLALLAVSNPFKTLFQPLIDLLQWLLNELHSILDPVVGSHWSWGLSIIILTIIVRLILMPLTFRQFRSAQAMQAIQPELKALQKKYKNDKQKLQQETMRLYQEYRVNPFASCLPLILQLPVFISLYYAIQGTEALKTASFLWIPELGKPDPTYVLFVIYVVTQMISTELMITPQTDPQQKMIMRLMPLFFVVILYSFPSGLFVYWITTNLWTIGQQTIIRKYMPAPTPDSLKASGKPRKESRFLKAMGAAQEARQAKSEGRPEDAKKIIADRQAEMKRLALEDRKRGRGAAAAASAGDGSPVEAKTGSAKPAPAKGGGKKKLGGKKKKKK